MSYIGNQPLYTSYVNDRFSGNGSTLSFTLSIAPANSASILVAIYGVLQDPATYGVVGNTLTFTGAPPPGTNNISVRYLGLPASNVLTSAYRTVTDITASAGQTTFNPSGYTPGFIDVYRNGARLGTADYTATNGAQVVLNNAAAAGDLLQFESFSVGSVLNAIPATAGAVNSSNLANTSVTASKLAAGSVTSTSLDVYNFTGLGGMALPGGSTGNRPSPAVAGTIRYNTTINQPEVWNGNLWAGVVIANADGSSAAAAGTSAQAIKLLTGTTTSGYYWITVGGTPTQVWCDMTGATAWMLLMRASSGGTTFSYDSAYWQNGSTGLNATSDPLTNTDIKNGQMWGFANITTMRLTGSTNTTLYTANPLTFGTFNATANTIFNSGANTWDAQVGYTRAEWLAWAVAACGNTVANFDTQPNCNATAINNTGSGPYGRVRIGWTGNNEADCATNDSWAGIGGYWNGTQENGGAQSWTPSVYTPCHLWLWTNSL